jgi:hypothetical protein
MECKWGQAPPSVTPPLVWDIWGACGASLRAEHPMSGGIGKTDSHARAKPLLTAARESVR